MNKIPQARMRNGYITMDGWTEDGFKQFMLEFHEIDLDDINGSTQKVFEKQYDIMVGQGVGKINAELMAAGIQWYLDTMARKALKGDTEV